MEMVDPFCEWRAFVCGFAMVFKRAKRLGCKLLRKPAPFKHLCDSANAVLARKPVKRLRGHFDLFAVALPTPKLDCNAAHRERHWLGVIRQSEPCDMGRIVERQVVGMHAQNVIGRIHGVSLG